MEDTAINLAHRYVQAAEEHQDRQKWTEAVEMHFRAAGNKTGFSSGSRYSVIITNISQILIANSNGMIPVDEIDQFLLATKDTQDQEVIKTLRFMNTNHLRQGKELQRKLAKAAADAAAAAVAAQQHPPQSGTRNGSSLGTTDSTSSGRRRASSGQHQQGNSGGLGQRRHNVPSSSPSHRNTLGEPGNEPAGAHFKSGDTGSGGSYLGTSSEASSNSSSAMIEESFTLVKSHGGKDKSDPFNRFWEELENLMHKISNPAVAFTSIPLDGDDPLQLNSGSTVLHSPTSEDRPPLSPMDGPWSTLNDTLQTDSTTKQSTRPTGGSLSSRTQQPRIRIDPSPMQESFFIIDSPSQRNANARTRSASTSESGPMSASSTGSQSKPLSNSVRRAETSPRGSKTMEEYAIENQQLKMTLDKLSKRNLKLEKQLEGVMQMSVWTKDVQRSAMQLFKSQDILRPVKQSIQDLSAATTPTNAYDQMNPTTMQARLKELEEELQQLKLENAKQNHLMKKYKQRWEDLKEAAKRRRNATPTPPEGGGDPTQGGDFDSPVLGAEPSGKFGGSTSTANPYSNTALAGSPSPSSGGLGQVARPPFSTLARASSASGPVVLPGGSYQRRIMMESKVGGCVLDHTPLNMHRQTSAGMVSSTTPRVLDTSPRTNVGPLPFVTEIPRQPVTVANTRLSLKYMS
ncbi:hypothetical protein BGZ95_010334 [Linnemannia exigua]|uniref:Uncharacterized protein n=1 Tax=Linnemannia exigua TaxID=604196 RepID=A0AAD4DBZ1_9FUNG|nr:hypothetical protein BGZ95_010334 [Linnemannia exigua]